MVALGATALAAAVRAATIMAMAAVMAMAVGGNDPVENMTVRGQ